MCDKETGNTMSHSTRVRGLKFSWIILAARDRQVALYTGAWIEIEGFLGEHQIADGRTLHECVD